MEIRNRENVSKGLLVLLALGIVAASITAASAWAVQTWLYKDSVVTSGTQTGSTSYTVSMDVYGRAGLQSDHTMYTKMYLDNWWPWPDTEVWSDVDNMDYTHTVSGLDSSKTYYVVWQVQGTTNTMDWTTLTFV